MRIPILCKSSVFPINIQILPEQLSKYAGRQISISRGNCVNLRPNHHYKSRHEANTGFSADRKHQIQQ